MDDEGRLRHGPADVRLGMRRRMCGGAVGERANLPIFYHFMGRPFRLDFRIRWESFCRRRKEWQLSRVVVCASEGREFLFFLRSGVATRIFLQGASLPQLSNSLTLPVRRHGMATCSRLHRFCLSNNNLKTLGRPGKSERCSLPQRRFFLVFWHGMGNGCSLWPFVLLFSSSLLLCILQTSLERRALM